MSEGLWIVLGAAIGVFGSFLAAWLKREGKRDYFDKTAIKFLKKKLKESPEGLSWDQISNIGNNIGLNETEIKQLLLLANAEPGGTVKVLWKLK